MDQREKRGLQGELRRCLDHLAYWESLAEDIYRSGVDEGHMTSISARCHRRVARYREKVRALEGQLGLSEVSPNR
jgi:hypothetical protein